MLWVFGYGSLIWKPPPHVVEQRSGYVKGVLRRFAQSSIDHRGTPERPGRVVTVLEAADWHKLTGVPPQAHSIQEDTVWGIAYRVAEEKEKEVWDYLEHREKNGYTAHDVEVFSLNLETQQEETVVPKATCWIGTTSNPAFVGYEPMDQLAERIATCEGPSGPNPVSSPWVHCHDHDLGH
ncbi:hypothetical protein FFLO_03663 [Filobasidium floriforme]|uniref:glutathione-specific gamma-glutamylcyclotransferase n=1 Tax=Filobasidium floriforme TaxID=5210 RepID=A0A8K0JKG7_9TREE|nr:hypothetical protein FFLO_03663 [Filobasidium floriforme]